jgi:hypothetical protein
MDTAVPDRIEKQILLRAPLARVWQALTDASEFGAWFGVKLDGPFKAGARVTGRISPTTADAASPSSAQVITMWFSVSTSNRGMSHSFPAACRPNLTARRKARRIRDAVPRLC